MAWIAALAGLAVSAYGQSSANSAAGRAGRQEAALRDRELRLAEAQNARGEQMWDEYRQTYLPREREFVADAFNDETSPELAAARTTTDVRAVQDQNRRSGLRDARRLGINPTSGAYAAMENDRSLRDTALEVTARDSSRRAARDENFQRQYTALAIGKGMPSQAGALTSDASRAIGGLADAASRRADQANQLAAEAGRDFGASLGELAGTGIDAWRNRGGGKPSSTSNNYYGS
jgi:hypothetical protein